MTRACVVLAVSLLGVAVPCLHAQAEAKIGDRARITSPEALHGRAVGVLQQSTSDSVLLSGVAIRRTSITRVEVSTGRKSHVLAGTGIGLLVGAGIGAGISCAAYCGEYTDGQTGLYVGAGGVVGGLLGGVLGAVIGAVTHSDRWTATSLGTLRVQPVAGPNGSPGMTVRLRF